MKNDKSFLIWVHFLCFTAGFINLATLFLYGTATSHLTGHLTRLVMELTRGNLLLVLQFILYLCLFFAGSVISGFIFLDKVFAASRAYGSLLVLLGLIFMGISLLGTGPQVLLPLLSFMLGVQNSLFVSYKGMLIRTTHFTGYITDAGFALGQLLRGRQEDLWKLRFCLASLGYFALGGLLASIFFVNLQLNILYLAGIFYILAGAYYALFLRKRIKG